MEETQESAGCRRNAKHADQFELERRSPLGSNWDRDTAVAVPLLRNGEDDDQRRRGRHGARCAARTTRERGAFEDPGVIVRTAPVVARHLQCKETKASQRHLPHCNPSREQLHASVIRAALTVCSRVQCCVLTRQRHLQAAPYRRMQGCAFVQILSTANERFANGSRTGPVRERRAPRHIYHERTTNGSRTVRERRERAVSRASQQAVSCKPFHASRFLQPRWKGGVSRAPRAAQQLTHQGSRRCGRTCPSSSGCSARACRS